MIPKWNPSSSHPSSPPPLLSFLTPSLPPFALSIRRRTRCPASLLLDSSILLDWLTGLPPLSDSTWLDSIPTAGLLVQMINYHCYVGLVFSKADWFIHSWRMSLDRAGNEFVGDFRNSNGYYDTLTYLDGMILILIFHWLIWMGWFDFDDEEKITKRAVELNNVRAAMMGMNPRT